MPGQFGWLKVCSKSILLAKWNVFTILRMQTLARWNVFTLVLTLYCTRKSLLPCGIVVANGVRGRKVELSYTLTSLQQYSLAVTRFARGLCRQATIFAGSSVATTVFPSDSVP